MKQSKLRYWILAVRPKTLPASIIPVLIGSTLAFHDRGFKWIPAIICFLFALIAQIVSNLLNDYFDYKSGADQTDRLGPDRVTSKGWIKPETMLRTSLQLIALACLLGCGLIYYAGWQMIGVGILVCIGAFGYSSGPFPLASKGLGDVCVIIFYGIIPVGFTYYVQALHWTSATSICGLAAGLVITNILVANNYRDRKQDKRSGKNTSIVLFGETFGRWFYFFNGIAAVITSLFLICCNLKLAAVLPLIYLIPHTLTWKEMCRIREGKELNKILELSARNIVIFGLLIIAGILFS